MGPLMYFERQKDLKSQILSRFIYMYISNAVNLNRCGSGSSYVI